MFVRLIFSTLISFASAADLTMLNEFLAPTGVGINKDGTINKGKLSESRLPGGRIAYHRSDKPDGSKSGREQYADDWWEANVSRGKDGSLTSVSALRFQKAGLPTDEFTATLNHGSISSITSCRHPGEKSCVTATATSCSRIKSLSEKSKSFAKEREQCGKTLENFAWVYDANAVAAARNDLSQSTTYATSPLAGVGTVFQALDNLKENCDKYGGALAKADGETSSRPAGSAR